MPSSSSSSKAEPTVQLFHPDADKPITVSEDQANAYLLGGWSPADPEKKTTN
jgi:hypothetical protein